MDVEVLKAIGRMQFTVLLSIRSAADVRDKITTIAAPPPIIEASK